MRWLIVACALLALGSTAQAQVKLGPIGKKIIEAGSNNPGAAPAASSDDSSAVPCSFEMLVHIKPLNLLPTIKGCIANKLVDDTSRALDSAKAYGGTGDQDGVNCLAPALAIFKAGVPIPGTPDVPAVLNADGAVKTPAVAGTPEQEPGPILLFQKYREFTLAGGLSSCQNWINGPVAATAGAAVSAATGIAGAAILAPKIP